MQIEGKNNSNTYRQSEPVLNLARARDATGHVAVVDESRPFHYVAPLNDGLLRVSVSDAPGDLSTKRQAYGIVWEKEKQFNTVRYFAGRRYSKWASVREIEVYECD